ncbi:hypothetical protein IGI37_001697 [Enterococcus sp. AZ194]|uniref:hypothetical protein n=1 Tax=Enterococcus sp. AZ194 TaxID=2774629 RepID=UPI003F22134D
MKKIVIGGVILASVMLLVACSNSEASTQETTQAADDKIVKINKNLSSQLVGKWFLHTDGEAKEYEISESEGYVYFDGEKLKVTETTGNHIHTQTEEKQPLDYVFRLEENKVTVLPSYEVSEGSVGGSLAPIELNRDAVKQVNINKTSSTMAEFTDLIGEWKSEEEQKTYYIRLSLENETEQTLRYVDNLDGKDSQLLKVEEVSNQVMTALTEDESSRYFFDFSEKNILTAASGINPSYYSKKGEDVPEGMSKPIRYKKID